MYCGGKFGISRRRLYSVNSSVDEKIVRVYN